MKAMKGLPCIDCRHVKILTGRFVQCTHPDALLKHNRDRDVSNMVADTTGRFLFLRDAAYRSLRIVANLSAIRRGWFNWPDRFIPFYGEEMHRV
jgi:hypothetical protein